MPTLVIKKPDGKKEEHQLDGELTVGRAEGNDVVLSEGGVSRKHARFFQDEDSCVVEDLGSANGTWVDGTRISRPTTITAKSAVVIGDYDLRLKQNKVSRDLAPVPPQALAKRAGAPSSAHYHFRGLTGSIAGKTFPLAGKMTIGRVAGVDIRVEDDSVSRQHAEVVASGSKVSLRDLGSANGTTVNGIPITSRTTLAHGDVIQFGVVELVCESRASLAAPAGPARANRAGGDRPVRRGGGADAEGRSAPTDLKKKRLLIAGVVLATLVAMVIIKVAISGPNTETTAPGPKGKPPVVERRAEEQIDELLATCRTFSDPDHATPDWTRAQAACQKIIDLEPIHQEANALLKRISLLRVCEETFHAAREQIAVNQLEAALESFSKMGKDCDAYLLRARGAAKETLVEVKKRAGADCRAYSSNAKWELAYKRCELYAKLACQTMEPHDLYPDPTRKLKLEGSVDSRTEWRPQDPLYLEFLKVRSKVKAGEPLWVCPEIAAFRPPPAPPDPSKLAKDELTHRFPEPEMGLAMVMYFEGRFVDAPVPLKKIGENMKKAQFHEAAKELLNDISNAINLYENGMGEITNGRPERAEANFLKALALDERLVLGDRAVTLSREEKRRELDRRVSFLRKNVVEAMASRCLQKGRALADRKDFRGACKMWKLGGKFSTGNIDLLKALTNVCTVRAKTAFANAESCEQLRAVLDFAVEGDTFKEQIEDALAKGGCR